MIYTMTSKSRSSKEKFINGGGGPLAAFENFIGRVFTKPERVCAFNTTQFADYSKYDADGWDEAEKKYGGTKNFRRSWRPRARRGVAWRKR